ncbi:MAG: sulfatase-like hydrolase/transferase [Bacteroidetes bacterium]|nr:sulfatase-like hydrolase/transferase [Bacteroidota bacterium]
MTRSLAFIFALLLLVMLPGCSNKESTRPNIILILADDFGYMDSQIYAARLTGTDKSEMYYETPNIDMLSGEGVSFSWAYANQLCSPTRAAILTGKYAGRLGFTTAAPSMKTFYNTNQEVPDGRSAHQLLQNAGKIKNITWLNGACNTAVPAGTIHDRGKERFQLANGVMSLLIVLICLQQSLMLPDMTWNIIILVGKLTEEA